MHSAMVKVFSGCDADTIDNRIEVMKHLVKTLPEQPSELEHNFGGGIYTRALHLLGGSFICGKTHAKSNLFVLTKGKMTLVDKNGIRLISAPYAEQTEANTRRFAYVHEHSIVLNMHATDKTDLTEIEEEFIRG